MMNKKLKVGVLLGGRSAEHEVSLLSANNIIGTLDKNKYDVFPIIIDKDGKWFWGDKKNFIINENNPQLVKLNKPSKKNRLIFNQLVEKKFDIIFPVLHGPYGEDGSVQGLLKLLEIPYVGTDILGSAINLDKVIEKRLLKEAGILVPKFLVLRKGERISFINVKKKLGLPVFIKPANLGSSVGISKVRTRNEFNNATKRAFLYDNKIILEEFIKGDEIFCSVLGNENPSVSVLGRLKTNHDFYDYNAKYIDDIKMEIPFIGDKRTINHLQETARKAYQELCCQGMARVDMFLTKNNKVYLCEINTIPGFTGHSWYPLLWNASGISTKELLDKLISLALKKFKEDKKLKTII